jgi:hypothetical protein
VLIKIIRVIIIEFRSLYLKKGENGILSRLVIFPKGDLEENLCKKIMCIITNMVKIKGSKK